LDVACGFIESVKDMAVNKFTKPSIFSWCKVCYRFSRLLMVNAEKRGAKLEKWGAMPTCYRLTFMCC